jgi:hypothetical protein
MLPDATAAPEKNPAAENEEEKRKTGATTSFVHHRH